MLAASVLASVSVDHAISLRIIDRSDDRMVLCLVNIHYHKVKLAEAKSVRRNRDRELKAE